MCVNTLLDVINVENAALDESSSGLFANVIFRSDVFMARDFASSSPHLDSPVADKLKVMVSTQSSASKKQCLQCTLQSVVRGDHLSELDPKLVSQIVARKINIVDSLVDS